MTTQTDLIFGSIFTNGTITGATFLIATLCSIAIGIFIAFMYTIKNSYSKSFIITLSLLPAIVGVVIMMVNGNLGTSIAILGSFSLIRFRSIPGNSKEIINVFFAMAAGLACGTGYIGFAILITIVISLFMLLLNVVKFGETSKETKILKITVPEEVDYTDCFNDIFNIYTSSIQLTNAKTTNMGSMFELTYNVKLKQGINEKEFIDEIRVRNGNLKVSLSHPLIGEAL